MEGLRMMAAAAAEQVNAHPVTTTVAGIAATIISIMQSAQSVAGTLIAFATSIAGLVTVILQVRRAWRNRNKE